MSPPLPPFSPEQAPTHPHCICLSGLTDAQLKLAQLLGALSVVEWLTVEAQSAVSGPAGDPPLRDYLAKLQAGLVKAQGRCLNSAFPRREWLGSYVASVAASLQVPLSMSAAFGLGALSTAGAGKAKANPYGD